MYTNASKILVTLLISVLGAHVICAQESDQSIYTVDGKDYPRAYFVEMSDRGGLDSALTLLQRMADLARDNHQEKAQAMLLQAELLFFSRKCRESVVKSHEALEILDSKVSVVSLELRENLGLAYNCVGQPDSALLELDQVIASGHLLRPKTLAKAHYSRYNCYLTTARYDKALESLFSSREIYESLGDASMAAIMDNYIGEIYHTEGQDSLGYAYHQKALDYFLAHEEMDRAMFVYMNRGSLYSDDGLYDLAISDLSRAVDLGRQMGNLMFIANASEHLGDVHMALGNLDEARTNYSVTEEICDELGFPIGQAAAYIGLGEVALQSKDGETAVHYGTKAEMICEEHEIPSQLIRVLPLMASAYELVGDFEKAYYYKSSQLLLRDSIYNVERSEVIAELREQYEGEKKLRRIESLENQASIDKMKRTGLLTGLGLLLFLSGLIINREVQRRKKAKQLHETEKRLAETEHQRLKEQLDHKNRELTSNALNMARKNEFLTVLNEQLIQLNSSMDLSKDLRGLRNQLRIEGQMEDNWEQFTAQFTETNPQFYKNLRNSYPDLSKGDLRLAALLRMNLGNKDIARILSISDDGVKKARYRLRKKLSLQTDDSLEKEILKI